MLGTPFQMLGYKLMWWMVEKPITKKGFPFLDTSVSTNPRYFIYKRQLQLFQSTPALDSGVDSRYVNLMLNVILLTKWV